MIGFINSFLRSLFITINYNSSQKWLPKTRSILTGPQLSSLLVFLLLFSLCSEFLYDCLLIGEWITNDEWLRSYLYGRLYSVAYIRKMFVECSFSRKRVLYRDGLQKSTSIENLFCTELFLKNDLNVIIISATLEGHTIIIFDLKAIIFNNNTKALYLYVIRDSNISLSELTRKNLALCYLCSALKPFQSVSIRTFHWNPNYHIVSVRLSWRYALCIKFPHWTVVR
jgi:hypothetical protein